MALIKSTILAQISGSINGTTFAHNRGGAYARNRSNPVNPGTNRQDNVRTSLASLSVAWRDTLTEEQRTLWRNYGANTTVINRVGDQVTLSGIAAYQRVNLFRLSTLSLASLATPPTAGAPVVAPPAFESVTIVTAAATDPTVTVNVANGSNSVYGMAVYYSGPLSPGLSFYRGPYIAHTAQDLTNSPFDVPLAGWPQGDDAAGSKVALKITCYNIETTLPVWSVFVDPIVVPAIVP